MRDPLFPDDLRRKVMYRLHKKSTGILLNFRLHGRGLFIASDYWTCFSTKFF
jgi:hypothetical protein